MSEAAITPAEGTPEGTPEGGATPESERTFTQADLNKIAANEKRDGTKAGRQAAITELLEKAGAESLDDVLSGYTEYKNVQEVTETEADRARKSAERLEKRAKKAEEQYTNTLREFALRDALRDSGINSARLPLALKVAEMQNLVVEDGRVDGVEAVVETLKEASPEWFGEPQQRMNAPQTEGTGVQRPGSSGTDAETQHANFLASLMNLR